MMFSAASVVSLLLATELVSADGPIGSLLSQLQSLGQSAIAQLNSGPPQANPIFNAKQQFIDTTGVHQWLPPGPDDQRGPCPGLNALANHGYLPRNGFATIFDLVSANTQVYGMGLDLATILTSYGAALDGPGAGWSIGGQPHTGISGSHGNYEIDSSPCRGDLFQYGNSDDLVLSQFKELLNMQPDPTTANYDINVIETFRGNRFQQSIQNNPYFYYGPFAGTAVSNAAHTFIFRLMANHTPEFPAGLLNQEVLKSFFAVTGSGDNLTWTPGWERIPNNWYRRALNDDYGVNGLNSDIAVIFQKYPVASSPGCNTGTVNTFTHFDLDDTNANDYNFSNPTDGLCFGLAEAVASASPVTAATDGVVNELLIPLQNALGCKTVPNLNSTVGQACPGYTMYGGPTGPIAPGAKQN